MQKYYGVVMEAGWKLPVIRNHWSYFEQYSDGVFDLAVGCVPGNDECWVFWKSLYFTLFFSSSFLVLLPLVFLLSLLHLLLIVLSSASCFLLFLFPLFLFFFSFSLFVASLLSPPPYFMLDRTCAFASSSRSV